MSIVDAVRAGSVIGGFVKMVRPLLSRLHFTTLRNAFFAVFHVLSYHSHILVRVFFVPANTTLQDHSSKRWHEVPDATAREKVGQQIRETLAKMNPMKCDARKVQRKTKAKRPRLSATSTSMLSSSTAVSFSSTGEELSCSGTTDDTDDTTPLQVDFSTMHSNYNNSISISPPTPPPSPPKGFDNPIAFAQSGKSLHTDMDVSQLVPDWQDQQEQVWNYYEV
jgi:hypothetical protein